MKQYPTRAASRKNQLDLLFLDRECEVRVSDPGARRIARQFGLPIHHAATIARLAGLGEQS